MKDRIERIRKLLENRKNHAKARELIEEIRDEVGVNNLPVTLECFIDYLNGV